MARRGRNKLDISPTWYEDPEDIQACDYKTYLSKKYRWRKDWAYCQSLEHLLTQEHVGTVLNFPCGFSSFGNCRADIDPQCRPDVIADLRNPPFPPLSFDTVHSDPPYSLYNKPGFIIKLFDIARKKVILDDLPLDWKPSHRWARRWAICTRNSGMIIKVIAIYERKDPPFEGFSDQEYFQAKAAPMIVR